MYLKYLSPVLIAFLVTGCMSDSSYERPNIATPADWANGSVDTQGVSVTPDWWSHFKNPVLDRYVSAALQNNTDIGAAVQRVEQSRAQVRISGANLLPAVSVQGNLTTNDNNRIDRQSTLNGGLNISYEIDLWGRNSKTKESARKSLQAILYDKDAIDLIVASDTAQAYFNLIALDQRIKNAEDNLTLSKDVTRLIGVRHSEGSASGQDVAQQNTAIASVEANLSSLRQQRANALSALNVLMGQAPQTALPDADQKQANTLDNVTVPVIAPLQPSSLLERRPDIRATEEQLKAADINIAIARTNFFPSLTLGAGTTAGISPLSSPVTLATNAAAGLTAPMFQGGRLEGQLDLATARQRELAAIYRGNVLTAFQESEQALAAVKSASEREASLLTARNEARRYYTIARERYLSGADDFLTLLDAQRTMIQADDTYIQAQLDRLSAALLLFKAMGGGWSSDAISQ